MAATAKVLSNLGNAFRDAMHFKFGDARENIDAAVSAARGLDGTTATAGPAEEATATERSDLVGASADGATDLDSDAGTVVEASRTTPPPNPHEVRASTKERMRGQLEGAAYKISDREGTELDLLQFSREVLSSRTDVSPEMQQQVLATQLARRLTMTDETGNILPDRQLEMEVAAEILLEKLATLPPSAGAETPPPMPAPAASPAAETPSAPPTETAAPTPTAATPATDPEKELLKTENYLLRHNGIIAGLNCAQIVKDSMERSAGTRKTDAIRIALAADSIRDAFIDAGKSYPELEPGLSLTPKLIARIICTQLLEEEKKAALEHKFLKQAETGRAEGIDINLARAVLRDPHLRSASAEEQEGALSRHILQTWNDLRSDAIESEQLVRSGHKNQAEHSKRYGSAGKASSEQEEAAARYASAILKMDIAINVTNALRNPEDLKLYTDLAITAKGTLDRKSKAGVTVNALRAETTKLILETWHKQDAERGGTPDRLQTRYAEEFAKQIVDLLKK